MSDKKDVPGSLDQPGLELASQYQPPEVAHGQAPEAYTPADDRWRSEKYVIPNTPNQDSHYDQTPRNDEQPGGRTEKRTCGIQRKKFLWIMLGAVVLVIVVLAAVLGGVLGSRKGSSQKPNETTSGPANTTKPGPVNLTEAIDQARKNTGVAVIGSTAGVPGETWYTYYQQSDGSIIELPFPNDTLTEGLSGDIIQSASSILPPRPGTPLAATTWIDYNYTNGEVFRAVFYISTDGDLVTLNTTGSQAWSSPSNILSGDKSANGSIALAVCANTSASGTNLNTLNGLRVYYGSAYYGGVQEVGYDFNQTNSGDLHSGWLMFSHLGGTDAISGVACSLSDNKNSVYTRSANNILQHVWDYSSNYQNWIQPINFTSSLASVTDIAAGADADGNDAVFFQDPNGNVQRTSFTGIDFSPPETIELASPKAKLAAAFNSSNTNVTVMYQESSDPSTALFRSTSVEG